MNTTPPTHPILRCLAFLLAALLWADVSSAAQLIITGLEDEDEKLAENIELLAGDVPEDVRLHDIYVELLPDQARKALAAYGYFKPEIIVSRKTVEDDVNVNVRVKLGPPVLISAITVKVTGPGEDDEVFLDALARSNLKQNEPFVSGDYEATKSLLIDAAQAKGYFDFKFVTSTVLVSKTDGTAIVNLVANSGLQFTFGGLQFDQSIFTEKFLARWAPFEPGDFYDAKLLSELNDNLQNSGYFSSVRVTPKRDVSFGATVPVLVSLERKESNQVGIGIGYTNAYDGIAGLRGKLTWQKPLINSAGHSADVELNLSTNTKEVSLTYRIPRENDPLYNFWGIEYGLRDFSGAEDQNASFLSRLNFERVRRFQSNWNESLFFRYEREFYDIEGVSGTSSLIMPGFAYTRKRSKGAPFITWGQSSTWEFLFGNRNFLSSIDFIKTEISFKYIRAVTPKNSLTFSMRYGAITTNDYPRVPLSQRFFAGGDRSIRGYNNNEVSPRSADGTTAIGGRYLETGSLEYNYRFKDRWSFATFADIGRAFNRFSASQEIGAGFGVRWQSPVGPFRIDLAIPVTEGFDEEWYKDIKLHLSLGPEL